MILAMAKVRVLAPRRLLYEVLFALQEIGQIHLTSAPRQEGLMPLAPGAREQRRARQLRRVVEDIDVALAAFGPPASSARTAATVPAPADFARWLRTARRARRSVEGQLARLAALEEERALLEKYRHFFAAFQPLLSKAAQWKNMVAYHVVLRDAGRPEPIQALRRALGEAIGDGYDLWSERLSTGELALLIVVAASAAQRVESLLHETRVEEIPLPKDYAGRTLGEALPAMAGRLDAIPGEIQETSAAIAELAARVGDDLRRARAALVDRLAEIEALALVGATTHAIVIDGWLPASSLSHALEMLQRRFGSDVVVEELAREEWAAEDAPVVLRNPRLFRPFEVLIGLLPLPRYGTIDPTPFVAVFFPMLFGIILGDIGYGLVLAALALFVRSRTSAGSTAHALAEVAGAGAVFSIIFGVLFGEAFGDAGRRLIGLHPLLFDREEALLPFLGLAVAIGLVHVLTGLVLGTIAALRQHPKHALGQGVTALMLLLIAAAILAALGVLPHAFFTPTIVVLLVAFALLVFAEGLIAPVELLSTVGNVLSYARVMAIGTASVMMAVVANRMTGMLGSVLVGALFALIFHLVNFALGLFSPAIHALRLHYVEFFGKFYSPGGTRYRPFGHGSLESGSTIQLRERA
jgi:V/A-type H+-transporting ATPase subunit I